MCAPLLWTNRIVERRRGGEGGLESVHQSVEEEELLRWSLFRNKQSRAA